MKNKAFSLKVTGTICGILKPCKAISNMATDDTYKGIITNIKTKESIKEIFLPFLHEKIFDSLPADRNRLLKYYMKIQIVNFLNKLDFESDDIQILDNTNVIFAFFPIISEYDEKSQNKIKQYPLELSVFERIGKIVEDHEIDPDHLELVFLDFVDAIVNKRKNYKTNNDIQTFKDLKNKILNDSELIFKKNQFDLFKMSFNINKQGSDTFNNIFYNSPIFLTQSQTNETQNILIEGFKYKLPNILQTSIAPINPISKKNDNLSRMTIKDLFLYINHYKKMIRLLDIKSMDSELEFIFRKFLKMTNEHNIVQITIKNNKKEIEMKTAWFYIGQQFSRGILLMHSSKGLNKFQAIASTKEDLVNTLSMKKPKKRSEILLTKYLVKFNFSAIEVQQGVDPSDLLEMTDEGFKEFILGLYGIQQKEEK